MRGNEARPFEHLAGNRPSSAAEGAPTRHEGGRRLREEDSAQGGTALFEGVHWSALENRLACALTRLSD